MDLRQAPELQHDAPFEQWRGTQVWAFLQAARAGDAETITRMLADDATLVRASYWYMPAIHFAVREGHLEVVKLLAAAGADLSYRSSLYGNDTLLMMTQERGHQAVAAYLQEQLARQWQSRGEELPIHRAASAGDLATVARCLAETPALARTGDHIGRSPFQRAMESGSIAVAALLLAHGAEVDQPSFSSDDRLGGPGFRPVVLALWYHPYWRQRNHYALAGWLLGRGADYSITIAAAMGDIARVRQLLAGDKTLANQAEACGKRPLSAAAERGHLAIVKELLAHGAKPTLPEGPNCPHGHALWAASHGNHLEMAELLLQHGADPNGYVESSGTPTDAAKIPAMRDLMMRHGGRMDPWSLVYEGKLDAVTALLDQNPKVFDDPKRDGTPFTAAVTNHNQAMVELLLSRGVRVPGMLTGCQTYLWHDLALTRMLLEHGMDPNLPNWQSMTPMHFHARAGKVELAQLFREFGASLDLLDEEYRSTPLGWAARFGQLEMVKWLLSEGADAALAGAPWATPLVWAESRGHHAIAVLLRQHLG
jgi:ankyrin repeat protein